MVSISFSPLQIPSVLLPLLTEPVDFNSSCLLVDPPDLEIDFPNFHLAASGAMAASSSTAAASSLPEVIRDLGYQFTAKPETCRSHLMRICGQDANMHAATVARIVGVMVRTHTGLDDSATLQNLNATGTSLWDKDKSEPKTWNVEVNSSLLFRRFCCSFGDAVHFLSRFILI